MEVSIRDYEDYLYHHYKDHGIDSSLFMKLVEEVGEVAEVLNKRDGRKASNDEDLKSQLANELADVIHYAFAIASLNSSRKLDGLHGVSLFRFSQINFVSTFRISCAHHRSVGGTGISR